MKASSLLVEIQEKVQTYPIDELKKRVSNPDIDRVNYEIGKYNLENYEEILNYKIEEDYDISDETIQQVKDKMVNFFKKYPVELKEFEDFITYICLFLTYIAKKPLHPVGFYFSDEKPLYLENGKYYCQKRKEFIEDKDAMCHNCIAIF